MPAVANLTQDYKLTQEAFDWLVPHPSLSALVFSLYLTQDYKLTQEAFDWLVGEIEARFYQAQAHPGECIGSIAAQVCLKRLGQGLG